MMMGKRTTLHNDDPPVTKMDDPTQKVHDEEKKRRRQVEINRIATKEVFKALQKQDECVDWKTFLHEITEDEKQQHLNNKPLRPLPPTPRKDEDEKIDIYSFLKSSKSSSIINKPLPPPPIQKQRSPDISSQSSAAFHPSDAVRKRKTSMEKRNLSLNGSDHSDEIVIKPNACENASDQ